MELQRNYAKAQVIDNMNTKLNTISASDLPFDVTKLGTFHMAWEMCPGVYYVTVDAARIPGSGEFGIVTEDAEMISKEARCYGQPYPDRPDLTLFDLQADHGGGDVLDYEVGRYRVKNGLPVHDGGSLSGLAALGRESYPEYFGEHPVPSVTPWGPTLRHKSMANGIVWIETESTGWVLAISFPISENLSDEAAVLATVPETDGGKKSWAPCLFFTWQRACVPIFELLRDHPEWKETGRVDRAALMNALWLYHSEYADAYNTQEWIRTSDAMGAGSKLDDPVAELITTSSEAGLDFCKLP